MSISSDITLNTNVYSLKTQRATSAVRGDSARDLDKPVTLTISHESQKSGKVSSAAMFDSAEVLPCDANACTVEPTTDNIRVMLKIVHNPLSGRLNVETELSRLKADLTALMADADFWTRFLNQES